MKIDPFIQIWLGALFSETIALTGWVIFIYLLIKVPKNSLTLALLVTLLGLNVYQTLDVLERLFGWGDGVWLSAFLFGPISVLGIVFLLGRKWLSSDASIAKVFEKRSLELELKNKELEQSKTEMSKILADERVLEAELKRQKENIEKKVNERAEELYEEQIKLQSSIESLSIGFIITDVNCNVIQINDAAKHILCLSKQTGRNVGFFTSVSDLPDKCDIDDIEKQLAGAFDLRSKILDSIAHKRPLEFKDVSFLDYFLRIRINPIVVIKRNFEVIGSVVLVEDVTEERVLQRSRDEFFSIASHELRTPLTAIRGNTSLIKQFYSKILEDKSLREMVNDIHESSIRLIELVNDFLDTSRLEQGRMQFKTEEIDVENLVGSVIKEFQASSNEKKLQLKWENTELHLPKVLGDVNKAKQILINLIGNALKFTETGGVTVSASIIDNFVRVAVTDTGRGIAKENQSLLFRKFQQAGSSIITRDSVRGTGLGLYISKLMAEGMGGHIRLETSAPGQGSTFAFTLPIVNQNQPVARG